MILSALGPLVMVVAAPGAALTAPAELSVPEATLQSGAVIALETLAPPLPGANETAPDDHPPINASVVIQAEQPGHVPGDPLEHFNRSMFNVHQKVDRAVFRPVALAYEDAVPRPVRSGLRNFLRNLREPIVFLNDLLQLKPGPAIKTLGRFVFNSTLGLGGLLDIAKLPGLQLPHRPNGFGDTLGYYGVKPGPYLFLPLVGPTDLRDLLGGQADGLVLPVAVGRPFDQASYQIPKAVAGGLDQRAEADRDLNVLFGSAVDPYATLRSVYLQDRAGEIMQLKGKAATFTTPGDELTDPLADPAATLAPDRSSVPDRDGALAAPASMPEPVPQPELSDPLIDPAAGSN